MGFSLTRVIKNPSLLYVYASKYCDFKWINDETHLKLLYKGCFGRKLNLEDPQLFNEKLQWLKIHDRKPQYIQLVDKYEVKKYIAEKLGEEYVIPTLGVWEDANDIDFDKLPERFVLKCTHDSHSIVICTDKNKLDIEKSKRNLNKALKRNYFYDGRQWPYKGVKPRIIAEAYMEDSFGELRDYKFTCFDGCSICRRSTLCRLLTHMYPRERIWCRFFALSFCLARENFPTRDRLISWARETVCSSTAGKRTVCRHLTISGRFNGAIFMYRPFWLCIPRAKQLLRFTDMTVDEVGVAVGMGDANYFSRMFRKVEGSSPREYGKQW